MIYAFNDYRSFLKTTLADRVAKNPQYSLRAMSKQIGLAPSTLSEVMQGKKRLSFESGLKISSWLKFNAKETEYLTALIQMDTAKSEQQKIVLNQKMAALVPNPKTNLSIESFRAISEWHHIPILELTLLKKFDFNARNVARVLGLRKAQAESSIDRLERLQLIAKQSDGRYKKTKDNLLVSSEKSNSALRVFHKQMLEKAIDALEEQSPNEKLVGSETLAFSQKNLAQANAAIEECFQKLIELSNKSTNNDSIYHLGIQFFKLTKGEKSL